MPYWQCARLLAAGFSTVLLVGISSDLARADDCTNETALKSPDSSQATALTFRNRSGERRRLYWIDRNGTRKFYAAIDPGGRYDQPTYVGHLWVVTNDAENCLYTFAAGASPQTVNIGGAADCKPNEVFSASMAQCIPR